MEHGIEVWDENRKWRMSANGYIFSSSDDENDFFIYDSNDNILFICENVMTLHVKYINGNIGSIYN